MLQTGHSDRQSIPGTIETLTKSQQASPTMPVVIGEVCYEGIMEASRQEVQRFMFWAAMLSGNGGHTYGANGIWQVNAREKPYGLSPHGHSWGGPSWDIAAQLPGSGQLGIAKGFLTRYSWWKLEAVPDSVEPRWSKENYWQPFAGKIPGEAIITYSPMGFTPLQLSHLDSGSYRAFFLNPSDGTEVALGNVNPDSNGIWKAPEFPIFRDWVLVLENKA